jgi:hypothetical protein
MQSEAGMFDINQNPIPDGSDENGTRKGGDDALLQACQEFFRLNKIWLEANPEGDSCPPKPLSYKEHYQLALDRQEALQGVIRLSPNGSAGLSAKYEVLRELRRLEEEDSPGLLTFAVTLVDEYHQFSLRDRSFQAAIEDRKPKRFNLNFFGMFAD